MPNPNDLSPQWEYYKSAARLLGRDKKNPDKQERYSLHPFYDEYQSLDKLNDLTRAFLLQQPWAPTDQEPIPPELPSFFLYPPGSKKYPDDSQLKAIRAALSEPISFIYGAPGTGKTETILNLASCIGRLGKTAAIVSANNSALDDIAKKIKGYDGSNPNQKWLQTHFAQLGNAKVRKNFHLLNKDSQFQFADKKREPVIRAEQFLERYPIISSTIHSLKNCFSNGAEYCYDFVIIDEASQVNIIAGIIAMSAARRLVLAGDPMQLPPVITEDDEKEIKEQCDRPPKTYPIKEELSFLDACCSSFRLDRSNPARVFLDHHHRCHPGIIQFCSEHIYKDDGEFTICTENYNRNVRIPIKVLWFEGKYCEKYVEKETLKHYSKRNRKQTNVFLTEEWPELQKRLQAPDPPSVCILSPFRGQLNDLKEALEEKLGQAGGDIKIHIADHTSNSVKPDPDEPDGTYEIPMLTIHKAQGREYNIVYLLPVEDNNWERPWTQKKRLINVAVSRAVDELRIITSTALMDRSLQEKLTGYYISPNKSGNRAANSSNDEDDNLFLKKLITYVCECTKNETGSERLKFGLHQTKLRSIYDKRLLEEKATSSSERAKQKQSAPEALTEESLIEVLNNVQTSCGTELSLYANVPIQHLRTWNDQPLDIPAEFNITSNHFDFLICQAETDRILLALEVDGGQHRHSDKNDPAELEKRQKLDKNKNQVARDFFHADCYPEGNIRPKTDCQAAPLSSGGSFAFLRLSDDGLACFETRALWDCADKELQEKFFPLEELIEAQLERELDQDFYLLPAMSFTAWARSDTDDDAPKCGASTALRQLSEMDDPLTQKIHAKKSFWIPTEKGAQCGILKCCKSSGDGGSYLYCAFSKAGWETARQLLRSSEGTAD